MTEHHDDPALLTGSHALDALSDDERALLEATLSSSPELRAETDSLRETALQLAYAVDPIEPPASLKASLMAQIASTPQAAPLASTPAAPFATAQAAPAVPTSQAAPSAPAGPAAPLLSTPVPETDGDAGQEARFTPAPSVTTRRGRAEGAAQRRWFQRPAAALSAAAAVAVVFLGVGLSVGTSFAPSNEPGPGTTQASSGLDRIYAASDFKRSTAKVAGGGTATVVWSNDLGKSAVILDGVAQAPKGKTYQLWYIGSEGTGGKITAAGLLDGSTDGVNAAVLSGSRSHDVTIGMTVEPEGGSKQPTTTPIMAVTTA